MQSKINGLVLPLRGTGLFLKGVIYMAKIKITGLDKLQKKLKKNTDLNDVKRLVKKHGSQMETKAQQNAPVGTPESTGIPGYVGGTLKRSIGLEIKDGGMTAEVKPTAEYAPYVELGTRYMEAQPYLKPALDEQKEKFKKDMKKLVE